MLSEGFHHSLVPRWVCKDIVLGIQAAAPVHGEEALADLLGGDAGLCQVFSSKVVQLLDPGALGVEARVQRGCLVPHLVEKGEDLRLIGLDRSSAQAGHHLQDLLLLVVHQLLPCIEAHDEGPGRRIRDVGPEQGGEEAPVDRQVLPAQLGPRPVSKGLHHILDVVEPEQEGIPALCLRIQPDRDPRHDAVDIVRAQVPSAQARPAVLPAVRLLVQGVTPRAQEVSVGEDDLHGVGKRLGVDGRLLLGRAVHVRAQHGIRCGCQRRRDLEIMLVEFFFQRLEGQAPLHVDEKVAHVQLLDGRHSAEIQDDARSAYVVQVADAGHSGCRQAGRAQRRVLPPPGPLPYCPAGPPRARPYPQARRNTLPVGPVFPVRALHQRFRQASFRRGVTFRPCDYLVR